MHSKRPRQESLRLDRGGSKQLGEEVESYQPRLTRQQDAERQCP